MSITINESVQKQYYYPQLGVYMPGVAEMIAVTYTAFNVSIENADVHAQFTVSVDGCLLTGHRELTFTPESTSGDLMSLAEAALQNVIENPTNEADSDATTYNDTNVDNPL